MFNFPFSAEVWGTVSDWVMIIVTSITAYFLWKTLRSQKEVQDTQNRLLKIEQLRVREDFKPNLKYNRVTIGGKFSDPNKCLVSIAVKNVSISPALNFKPVYEENPDAIPGQFLPLPRTLLHDGDAAILHFAVPDEEGRHLNCEIAFSVEYQDIAGTIYTQRVHFDAYGGGENFRTYDPKTIKEFDL